MDVVGAEEHGFAGGELDVVEEENEEEAQVGGELGVETLYQFGKFLPRGGAGACVAGEGRGVGFCGRDEIGGGFLEAFGGLAVVHDAGEDGLQGFLVL